MMNFKSFLMVAAMLLAIGTGAQAGVAQLQVIHNSADPAAEMVDVYVNGDLLLDDFAFRTATPFVEVPAGVELNIGVAPSTSMSPSEILATFPVTLAHGGKYVVMANGVLDPNAFAGNPDGKATGFNLYVKDHARTSARWHRYVDLVAFHGATDAPTVDILIPVSYTHLTLPTN